MQYIQSLLGTLASQKIQAYFLIPSNYFTLNKLVVEVKWSVQGCGFRNKLQAIYKFFKHSYLAYIVLAH